MEKQIILNSEVPESCGIYTLDNKEYMQYLYYPFKLAHQFTVELEPRLTFLRSMIEDAMRDYSMRHSSGKLLDQYGYITVKQTFVPKDVHHNRPGWHADGFRTSDVQYIWFDKFPTEFLIGNLEVSTDESASMRDMEAYAKSIESDNWWAAGTSDKMPTLYSFYSPPVGHLLYIDSHHVHRTTPATEDGVRTFIKITFSQNIYAQEGNSKNYQLAYNWDYAKRQIDRNQPHAK